jgi:hypothetical protein
MTTVEEESTRFIHTRTNTLTSSSNFVKQLTLKELIHENRKLKEENLVLSNRIEIYEKDYMLK